MKPYLFATVVLALAVPASADVPAAAPSSLPAAAQVQRSNNWDVLLSLYPKRALEAKEQGTVAFSVSLDQEGSPTACHVTASSGHPLLDQETCNLVLMHALFKPVTDSNGNKVARTLSGEVNWRLPSGGKPIATPVAMAGGEKMICKKTQKTGSLAGFERTCMSEREWEAARRDSTDPWSDLQGRKGSSHGN